MTETLSPRSGSLEPSSPLSNLPVDSNDELENLIKMKELLPSELPPFPDVSGEFRLLRFLRDSGGSATIAADRFRKFLVWRSENKVDELRQKVENLGWENLPGYSELRKHLPSNLLLRGDGGETLFDNQDRPISVERAGLINFHGFVGELSEASIISAHIAHLEKRSILLDQLSRARGEIVKMSLIKDFGGADLRTAAGNPGKTRELIRRIRSMVVISRDYYPETVGFAALINVPSLVRKLWGGVMSLLSPRHTALSTLTTEEELTKWFSIDVLPKQLGGGNACNLSALPGGLGRDRFGIGGGREELEIPRGKSIQVPFKVTEGDRIAWAIGVEELDLFVGVELRTQGTVEDPQKRCWLMPLTKISSDRCMRGDCEANAAGTIVLILDNSRSWVRSKIVHFKVEIIGTNDQSWDDGQVN